MTTHKKDGREPRNVVEEVRAARAATGREAGGLDGLGEFLSRIEQEYRTRTGRFSKVPTQRPAEVQHLIDLAVEGSQLLDELRSVRSGSDNSG